MGSLSSISALGCERLQSFIGIDEAAAIGPDMIPQEAAIARKLRQRDSLVEGLPVAPTVWIVQGFAVGWRGERQE